MRRRYHLKSLSNPGCERAHKDEDDQGRPEADRGDNAEGWPALEQKEQ